MLSVLIPVYNHNVVGLVQDLRIQAESLTDPVEIVVMDDGSDARYRQENRQLESRSNLSYIELPNNVGRSVIRNELAIIAKYNHLLFIDCDAGVADQSYLSRYVQFIKDKPNSVAVGGRIYQSKPPEQKYRLHWNYGSKRESLSAAHRNQQKEWYVHTSNLLVPRAIFEDIPFSVEISGYGYEDIAWGQGVTSAGHSISHIDNPLIHLGLKQHDEFIHDKNQSISNLAKLYRSPEGIKTKLTKTYEQRHLLRWFITPLSPFKQFLPALLKRFPSWLTLLDLYKYLRFSQEVRGHKTRT